MKFKQILKEKVEALKKKKKLRHQKISRKRKWRKNSRLLKSIKTLREGGRGRLEVVDYQASQHIVYIQVKLICIIVYCVYLKYYTGRNELLSRKLLTSH